MPETQIDYDKPIKEKDGWVLKRCIICKGTGTVDAGGISGVVPVPCEDCNGGFYWEHKATGVRARYLGGPFL